MPPGWWKWSWQLIQFIELCTLKVILWICAVGHACTFHANHLLLMLITQTCLYETMTSQFNRARWQRITLCKTFQHAKDIFLFFQELRCHIVLLESLSVHMVLAHTVPSAFQSGHFNIQYKPTSSSVDNYCNMLCCSNIDTSLWNEKDSNPAVSRSLDPLYYKVSDVVTEGHQTSLRTYF